jgi:hypothetical protein
MVLFAYLLSNVRLKERSGNGTRNLQTLQRPLESTTYSQNHRKYRFVLDLRHSTQRRPALLGQGTCVYTIAPTAVGS